MPLNLHIFRRLEMKFLKSILIVLIYILFTSAQEQLDISKRMTRYGFEVNRKPAVNFNIFVNYTKTDRLPQLYLGAAIQNDVLQFEKDETGYHARYQTSVAIRQNKNAVIKETWTSEVYSDNFEETNSKTRYSYHSYKLSDVYPFWGKKLSDGDYECLLEIRDLITKKSYKSKRNFTINSKLQKPEDKIVSTDITFFIHQPDSVKTLPLLPAYSILEYNKACFAYARIKTDTTDSVSINVRIYKTDKSGSQLFFQKYLKISVDSNACDILFEMPFNLLSEGKYRLCFNGEINQKSFSVEKELSVIWFEKPTYLYKVDLAVRPLKYLIPEEEFKRVKSLNYKDLQEWFNAFWKKKDPTEGTDYNELLYEYYWRVDETNRKFYVDYKEGWETDRGQIYLLYGKPQRVENRRYSTITLPHIVWFYDDEDLNFIFVDKDKNGEFVLLKDKEKD
jgi:GWxTD domain-containing protein